MERERRHQCAGAVIAMILAGVVWLGAGPVRPDTTRAATPVSLTLPNGLSVIVVERHGAPVFSGLTGCLAGYAFDPPDASGTAHLVEHLLAGATQQLIGPSKEIYEAIAEERTRMRGASSPRRFLLEAALARMNERKGRSDIATTADLVYYGLRDYPTEWVDRFFAAAANTLVAEVPAEGLEAARDAVISEIAGPISADARGRLLTPLFTTAYPGHPYGAPVGGRIEDVRTMTIASLRAFKSSRYSPRRCAVAVVGDVRPAAVFKLAAHALDRLPDAPFQGLPPAVRPQHERRATLESAARSHFIVSFLKPAAPNRQDAVADVVTSLLARQRDGRLQTALIATGLAAALSGTSGGPGQLYDDLLTFDVAPAAGRTGPEIERAIEEEFERLKTEPVSRTELNAAIARVVKARRATREDPFSLALDLLGAQLVAGDWRLAGRSIEMCRSVTAEEVAAFARRYLVASNRTVLSLVERQ